MYSRNCYKKLGTIDTQQAVLTNAQRHYPETHRLLEGNLGGGTANHVKLSLEHDYNEFLEVIAHANAAADITDVIDIYAARGKNDDYTYVCSIATSVGTHVVRGGTRKYNDVMTITEKDAAFEAVESSTATNEVAKVWLNTNGYAEWLFIVSDLDGTDLAIEVASVDRRNIPSVA